MREFFNDKVLLDGEASELLYEYAKNFSIIDYHCHLDQRMIAEDAKFDNLGEFWLSGDHYKWRAMRMCGVDERYITGDATWKEKFLKYAEIMPKLLGNPLYYWSHLELKHIFGINKPLNQETADDIYIRAGIKLKKMSVRGLLEKFKVEFVATTDNPCDDLADHKTYAGTIVSPTFRPDKLFSFDREAVGELGKSADADIKTYADMKAAVVKRLDYFVSKGCRITDHGFKDFPKNYLSDTEAEKVFQDIDQTSEETRDGLFGNFLLFLMREYKKRNLIVQLHFSVVRNINTSMFNKIGRDTGFDVMSTECDTGDLIKFLDKLTDDERPVLVLYTLNPNSVVPIACISGAFRNVHVGAAWWFNDTFEGIKQNLAVMSEYACLGTHLGMLTDSRSFSSYSRFDFFRRILCSFIGGKIDKGEYDFASAKELVRNICYGNIKTLLRI